MKQSLSIGLVVGIILVADTLYPQDKLDRSRVSNPAETAVIWAKRIKQGFNMRVRLSNEMVMGAWAWDAGPPIEDCGIVGIGWEYPVDSCIEHLDVTAPMIGGIINGVRRVSEGYNGSGGQKYFLPERKDSLRDRLWITHASDILYDHNFDPPRLLAAPVNRRQVDDDGDGKIDEDDLDGLDNDGDWDPLKHDLGSDGLPDSLENGCRGSYDPMKNPDPAFDNFEPSESDKCHTDQGGSFLRKNNRDRYTQNNGLPDHGEPNVDEDYAAISDQDVYCVATDTFSQPVYSEHFSMGVKIFQKSYAWKNVEAILPFEYSFVNVGRNTIRDVYLGFFADMDVGLINVEQYYTHNFAGYFRDIRTAYVHNAVDRSSTPAGITILGASRSLDSLRYVFQWYGFNELGTNESVIYSWLSCERFGYTDCIKPDQSPFSPSDTHFLISIGPFAELKPGDTLKLSLALVSGYELDKGPNSLRDNAIKAIELYNRQYTFNPVPLSPEVTISGEKNKVTLQWRMPPNRETWDDYHPILDALPDTHWRKRNPPAGHTHGGRNFEGFKVWRRDAGPSDNNNSVLLAQYDVDDDLQVGNQTGLRYSYLDSEVKQGNTYWYAVTAYSVPGAVVLSYQDATGQLIRNTIPTDYVESYIGDNAQKTRLNFGPSKTLNEVKVVPNPYRGDVYYTDGNGFEGFERDWSPEKRVIWFINLPEQATIRIYSLVGEIITTIEHDDVMRLVRGLPVGQEEWRLFSESERPIASGIYVFTVESNLGTQYGKFVIIL